MTEWKTYRAEDYCLMVTDGTHDSPKPQAEGLYLITSKHLKPSGIDFSSANRISETDYNKIIQRSKVEQYDILFSMIGTIGNIHRVTTHIVDFAVKNMGIFKMGGDADKSLWMYYWLQSPIAQEYIQSRITGSTQGYLTLGNLRDFPVCVPPLEEQRRIAGILGAIDDKIENNRRINANLELQAQALYKQWFVDFEFPNEDGKPYKSSGGKMVDSDLGPIPDGWRVIGYCDAVDIKGGGTPPTNNPEFWNGSIPFFTPKDVPSDCFAIHTEKSITEAGLSNCNSKLYAKDTVFITARGTVGKVVMAGCSMAMNQTNYALIGKNELSQYFVYLLTIALVDRLLKKANGAVFNAITTRDFEGEQIVHPTNFVLGKFIDIISPLYQQVLSIAKENETLTTLRDTLLLKLMNEEIKVAE